MHVLDIDTDDIKDINTFLTIDEHMYAQYICYPSSLAFVNQLIIKVVENTLVSSPSFSPNGWHATKFKGPNMRNCQYLKLLTNLLYDRLQHFYAVVFYPLTLWDSTTH